MLALSASHNQIYESSEVSLNGITSLKALDMKELMVTMATINIVKTKKNKLDLLSQLRDDNKKLHPCLVDFLSLPEPERNYNLQMSGETLK